MTRVLLSGEYSFLREPLERRGVETMLSEADFRLPLPVRFHPDLQLCHLKETMFALQGGTFQKQLRALGYDVRTTDREPAGVYPKDVLCSAFVISNRLVCNPKSVDPAILREAAREGLQILAVQQGYAACAAAVVNENSIITADPGMADLMRAAGFSVLQIRPGFIRLPGYDTGFIGGCCGLIEPGLLAVAGSLNSHPDGQEILSFLKEKSISIIELMKGPLLDVGGMIRLS